MEKYAVDLDKVLDELEYNEDRAEDTGVGAGRRHVVPTTPPTQQTNHHHSSFAPVKLADADFVSLPTATSATATHNIADPPEERLLVGSGDAWRPKPPPVVSQKTSVSGVFSSLNEYINSGSRLTTNDTSSGDGMIEPSHTFVPPAPVPRPNSVRNVVEHVSTDEKPDLIDSNVLRLNTSPLPDPMELPIQVNLPETSTSQTESVNCDEGLVRTHNVSCWQPSSGTLLPDIATAGTLASTLSCEEGNSSFDLISHRSSTSDVVDVAPLVSNESTPAYSPKVTNVSKSVLSERKTDFVSFEAVQDLSDTELEQYLQELEDEEDDISGVKMESNFSEQSNSVTPQPGTAVNVELPDCEMSSHVTINEHTENVGKEVLSFHAPKTSQTYVSDAITQLPASVSLSVDEVTSCEEISSLSQNDNGGAEASNQLISRESHLSKSDLPPLNLSIRDESLSPNDPSSPATPPTVPVTPTMPDAAVSFSSTFENMSITSACSVNSETQSATENVSGEMMSRPDSSQAELSVESVEDETKMKDACNQLKPARPCSLQIAKRAEPAALTDSSGSSETSPPSYSVAVGPPGATPCATRPPPFCITGIDRNASKGERIGPVDSVPQIKAHPDVGPSKISTESTTSKTLYSSTVTDIYSPDSTLVRHPGEGTGCFSSEKIERSSSEMKTVDATADSRVDVPTGEAVSPQDISGDQHAASAESGSPEICKADYIHGKPDDKYDPGEAEDEDGDTEGKGNTNGAEAVEIKHNSLKDEEGAVGGVEDVMGGDETADDPVDLANASGITLSHEELQLGKLQPFWVPDADAPCCMQCDVRFTVIKRRHHCRACGKVLCSKCCNEKAQLEYMDAEARVCLQCKVTLIKVAAFNSGDALNFEEGFIQSQGRTPNPNNPMEYCSTVPPLQQVAGAHQPAPSVMVPVGVLKREGSTKPKSEAKQVMFSDGIRPGGDLAELDGSNEPRLPIRRTGRISKRVGTPPAVPSSTQRTLPPIDPASMSYIPQNKGLPPVVKGKDNSQFEEDPDPSAIMTVIRDDTAPPVKFMINRNLYLLVKILTLDCCVNRVCWCFTSDGLSSVGQDEVIIILEVQPEEYTVPRDIFLHLNTLYHEAAKGNTVTEMGHTLTQGSLFLGSREHGGFLYVRPTFQCLHKLNLPPAPYLVGVLIHKWETPWARVFPIRLMLRLGAEYRYYPCPLVSIREREAVYGEIGHTIIQLLADFRNMAYTLSTVRGLVIHMEDKQTTILLPRNRYDQVMRALNNSNDHVLAFGANFSQAADSHLVCMQSDGDDSSYHTQAINIHNKPRKVTGASFVVFNGALKASSGMAAKSNIIEDGLMVKVTSETMTSVQAALRDMKDLNIICGPINRQKLTGGNGGTNVAGVSGLSPRNESSKDEIKSKDEVSPKGDSTKEEVDEVVLIKWTEDDRSFNLGVLSHVDARALDGVPSIRVHNGTDYHGEYRFIRWTEVFILKSEEGSGRTGDPLDISRLSEQLAKATCIALVKLLDLLAAASLTTLAVRATIHPDNVGYQAGSNGERLPPIYMKSLDDELVPVLHEAALLSGESPATLELVFRIMESG